MQVFFMENVFNNKKGLQFGGSLEEFTVWESLQLLEVIL